MLETPLSLVGYFSNLQKQLVLVTNERICKKIGGDRPFRFNFTYEHSVQAVPGGVLGHARFYDQSFELVKHAVIRSGLVERADSRVDASK